MPMIILKTLAELADFRRQQVDKKIVLVPTMGFLHEGHLSLIRQAKRLGDVVLTTIFVNPAQFGPNEDLEKYPRDLAGDLEKAKSAGSDAVFIPNVQTMYADDAMTRIDVGPVSRQLCGRTRTTHFDGVCTVVLKLFNLTGCHRAIFGEKDFQQLAVIRRMVRDLNIPVDIVGHPIVRASDGLALSSRNSYLTKEGRVQALALSRALDAAEALWMAGERRANVLHDEMVGRIGEYPGCTIEYVEVCDPDSLITHEHIIERHCLLALAVRVEQTRLIDNRQLVS